MHNEFIPREYLPTFNSCTIEMFLWNIPELEEHFIYFNDDLFVTKYVECEDYFKADKLAFNTSISCLNSMYGCQAKNSYDLIFPRNKSKSTYDILAHEPRPMLKSKCYQCYLNNQKQILESITRFRNSKNLNVYIYWHYVNKYHFKVYCGLSHYYLSKNITEDKVNQIFKNDTLCLNDCEEDKNIYENELINSVFKSRFPYASKYEIEFNPKYINETIYETISKQDKKIKRDLEEDLDN